MLSHTCFLLKSQEYILGKHTVSMKLLGSLLTAKYRYQFSLLGQSQNLMLLMMFFWKNSLSLHDMAVDCSW